MSAYYMSTPRGNYVVNSKGEILVGKPNFVYGTVEGYFSPQWKLYGLSERWNSRPILFEQLREKMDRGQTVEGYVHDIDHGTRRFWGGGKRLPKAKMYLDRSLRVNPPMYAHHLNEIKAHGLSVKQLRRLYAMVSRGNQKAITFARNVFGIPFDETASQVKAVVKHHLIDVGAGRVRGNPSKEILGQKKELVRVASEIALNLIAYFGPSMGYQKVANGELLPRSVRIVMNAMTEPEGINYEKYSMYFPRSYNRSEWQERGNMANHLWLGQTDRGRNEVIRKGIEIAKRGKVYSNRRRRRK